MNLPNKLTVLRVILVPFFVFFLLADFVPYRFLFALILFCAASYTDHLDGKIARRDNLITNFGKLMDPLADKIMVMAALICLCDLGLASTVCVILIMVREFAITSIRLLAVEQGRVIAANNWGKTKTVSQMVAIIAILLMQFLCTLVPSWSFACFTIGHVLIAIATFFTIFSGIIYVRDNVDVIRG
jgi:CDP-diacylglycerol--glycerol-3-phosphate 3-phosphatidyltransferase